MKKIIIFIMLLIVPINILAAGSVTISKSSISLDKGKTTTFNITANNAAGKVNISSSNTNVATVSTYSEFIDNNSISITVTGKSVGSANITVTLVDVSTYDEEELHKTYTIKVNVKEPTVYTPVISAPVGSTNNDLKSLEVIGYELVKEEDTYFLEVTNNVNEINIAAEADDDKAKVDGIGNKTLDIGENAFEIIITSESGSKKTYKLIVTKKDLFYLEDLNEIINVIGNNIDVAINEEDIIDESILNLIKDNKKIVNFNYYDSNKTLIYSWGINGSSVTDVKDIKTKVNFDVIDNINTLSNYANGIYVNYEHEGKLPSGTTFKLYVGNIYKDKDLVTLYYYDETNNKLSIVKEELKVVNGYIEYDIENCSSYFVSMSDIGEVTENNSLLGVQTIIIGVLIVMNIVLAVYVIKLKRR